VSGEIIVMGGRQQAAAWGLAWSAAAWGHVVSRRAGARGGWWLKGPMSSRLLITIKEQLKGPQV